LLPNGKVLVAGGGNDVFINNVELYDAASDSWSAAAPMAIARADFAATLLLDGRLLVSGGGNNQYLSSAELYDPTDPTPTPTATATITLTLAPTATPTPTPLAGCPSAPVNCAGSRRSRLLLRDQSDIRQRKLSWTWNNGVAAAAQNSFG